MQIAGVRTMLKLVQLEIEIVIPDGAKLEFHCISSFCYRGIIFLSNQDFDLVVYFCNKYYFPASSYDTYYKVPARTLYISERNRFALLRFDLLCVCSNTLCYCPVHVSTAIAQELTRPG